MAAGGGSHQNSGGSTGSNLAGQKMERASHGVEGKEEEEAKLDVCDVVFTWMKTTKKYLVEICPPKNNIFANYK